MGKVPWGWFYGGGPDGTRAGRPTARDLVTGAVRGWFYGGGPDGTRTRDLRRDRPAF